jgi:hypothetical protein
MGPPEGRVFRLSRDRQALTAPHESRGDQVYLRSNCDACALSIIGAEQWMTPNVNRGPDDPVSAKHPIGATKTVATQDGRHLTYLEVGDPDGPLVIHNHGGPSSNGESTCGKDWMISLYRLPSTSKWLTECLERYGIQLREPVISWLSVQRTKCSQSRPRNWVDEPEIEYVGRN